MILVQHVMKISYDVVYEIDEFKYLVPVVQNNDSSEEIMENMYKSLDEALYDKKNLSFLIKRQLL